MEPIPRLRRLIPWLLAAGTFAAFLPSLSGEFLNWDDDFNFTNNPDYRGLSLGHLKWMATAFVTGHYHPLTWLTLGVDYAIWGMNPLGYHLTSVLIHGACAVLLYFVLETLLRLIGRPGSPWPAFLGAAFYALHPLRVESVTWITERRDVLCGFFSLLCVLAYLRRADEERAGRSGTRWYVLSVVAFGASLLSKALSITLPGALLLLDLYPLGRFGPVSRNRGLVLSRLGRPTDAVADYTRSLQLRPGHAETLPDRGTARALAGTGGPALEDFTESLRLKPDAAVHLRRATLRGMARDWKGVVDDCSEALRLKPGSPDAYLRRGLARLEQNDAPTAAKDFEKALRLTPPGSPQRAQIEQFLQRACGGAPR